MAHLGNGASVTAVKAASPRTPPWATPAGWPDRGHPLGDIDPSALTTILSREGIDGERLDTILNKESGLLALAGSNDITRQVVEAAQSGDERAQLALDMTSYRLMKYIGGWPWSLAARRHRSSLLVSVRTPATSASWSWTASAPWASVQRGRER